MAINNITQTISTIPEAAHRGVDVQTQFVIKQEDFQDHLQGITVTELNTLKDQLNSRIGEINSTATTMNGYADTASAGASTATTKAGEASASASDALAYKNQAETFKNNASASATKASQWADNNYNVEVETGKYSAKHWSTVAQNTVNNKIDKVTSTDNAIVRFDGATGQVQNSSVVIDDNGNVGIGTSSPTAKFQVAGGFNASTLGSFPSLISSGSYGGGIGLFDSIGYTGMYSTVTGQVLNFFTNANNSNTVASSTKMSLDGDGNLVLTSGNLLLKSGNGVLGYGTGAGGTVTQLTSKSTAVTLNKPTGQITMNNAALAANGMIYFVLYNNLISINDNVKVSLAFNFGDAYIVTEQITVGGIYIILRNTTSESRSDAITLNFTVTKGANS